MHTVICELSFDAAHSLPLLPVGHKCHALHGHSYRVVVELSGELNNFGFVADYGEVKKYLRGILAHLDHKHLNTVFENPTTEAISEYIFRGMEAEFGLLMSAVTVYETPGNGCRYTR
jgi:6-pyruvoyltetrahydropterin/6-carboxytetrahydropterin synthase